MSFPPPVVTAARHALRDTFRELEVGGHVLLAISGGSDSMALAASAAFAAKENSIVLHSLTVDHGLRPESADEAACVVQRLQALGIDARAEKITLGVGLGPEGEARVGRYAALANEARRIWQEQYGSARACQPLSFSNSSELVRSAREPGLPKLSLSGASPAVAHSAICGVSASSSLANEERSTCLGNNSAAQDERAAGAVPVLLGHNANDQAETVLLGLARGSGARSVRGMPRTGALPGYADVPMIRPLLDMSSQSLEQVCIELGIEWVEDPTNGVESEWRAADGSMLVRSAIRHKIFPVLEDVFGKRIVDSLMRTGALLGSDDDALTEYARDALRKTLCEAGSSTGEIALSCADLKKYPQAIRTRVVRTAALQAGARHGELFFSHISALDKLIIGKENNLQVDLPGARAYKNHGILIISPGQSPADISTREYL